jgi:hypothetical protein
MKKQSLSHRLEEAGDRVDPFREFRELLRREKAVDERLNKRFENSYMTIQHDLN